MIGEETAPESIKKDAWTIQRRCEYDIDIEFLAQISTRSKRLFLSQSAAETGVLTTPKQSHAPQD